MCGRRSAEAVARDRVFRGVPRAKPRGWPKPAHIARSNITRSRLWAHGEHVFATETALIIRCIGLTRATARIALADLAYSMRRLVWLDGEAMAARPASAGHHRGTPKRTESAQLAESLCANRVLPVSSTSRRLRQHHAPG